MKNATTAKAAYECPECRMTEIDNRELICSSPFGQNNEVYEECDTRDWFNSL